jgi:hypothetical protein
MVSTDPLRENHDGSSTFDGFKNEMNDNAQGSTATMQQMKPSFTSALTFASPVIVGRGDFESSLSCMVDATGRAVLVRLTLIPVI